MYKKTGYTRGAGPYTNLISGLTNGLTGETYFNAGRVFTYDGEVWMCSDYIKTVNRTGVTIQPGTVMVYKSGVGSEYEIQMRVTANSPFDDSTVFAGVCMYQSVANGPLVVQYKGVCPLIKISDLASGVTAGSTNQNFYLTPGSNGGARIELTTNAGSDPNGGASMPRSGFGYLTKPLTFSTVTGTALLRPRIELY